MNLRVFYLTRRGLSDGYGILLLFRAAWPYKIPFRIVDVKSKL